MAKELALACPKFCFCLGFTLYPCNPKPLSQEKSEIEYVNGSKHKCVFLEI